MLFKPRVHGVRGDTPLHIAANNGDEQTCEDLLEHGADADALNDEHDSALHAVCRTGHHSRLVRIILEHSNAARSLNSRSLSDLATPLRVCIENLTRTRLRMARALLHAGADPNCSFNRTIVDQNNNSSYDIRAALGQDSVFDYLLTLPVARFANKLKNLDNSSESEMQTTTINRNTLSLNRLFHLIRMLVKAGYHVTRRDARMFNESWMRKHLGESGRAVMDDVFATGVTRPRSLKDLCRCELRRVLHKPMRASINTLEIPTRLKEFLTLQTID